MKKIFFLILLALAAGSFCRAAQDDNVRGWAWSENIGWISFNCENTAQGCLETNGFFGMNIRFDGYVDVQSYLWAGNGIGWISFDPAKTGNPPETDNDFTASGFLARVRNGKLLGWARALSSCQDDKWNSAQAKCDIGQAGDKAGGWDGWIKFSGSASDASSFGIVLNESEKALKGFAWGGKTLGWIKFDASADKKVETDFREKTPPSADNLVLKETNYCQRRLTIGWQFHAFRPDITETKYEVWISSDSVFPDADTIKIFGTASTADGGSDTISLNMENVGNTGKQIAFDTTYYWKVKVWDSEDPAQESDLSKQAPATFKTDSKHPEVNFTMIPDFLSKDMVSVFDGSAVCYKADGAPDDSCGGYSWDIAPAQNWVFAENPETEEVSQATDRRIYAQFDDDMGSYTITFTAKDNNVPAHVCTAEKVLENSHLQWREGIPFLYMKETFLASARDAIAELLHLIFK